MKGIRLIWLLMLGFSLGADATHIVGGGFDLTWQTGNTYKLKLRMLRDCANGQAQFDDSIYIGTFDKATNARKEIIAMKRISITPVSLTSLKCANVPTGLCVEVGEYSKIITLSPTIYNNTEGYYFSWERCCRNSLIQNIVNPLAASMAFYMEIPTPRLLKNSSPRWNNNPHVLMCKDNPYSYNFGFTDPDGDSLSYSLVTPLNGNTNQTYPTNNGNPMSGPYSLIQWAFGYTSSTQITGNPRLSIDPVTGIISVTPDVTGIFVSSIRVEEFRYGVKLGEVRLELQYTVSDCFGNPVPKIGYSNPGDPTVMPLNGDTLSVQIPYNLCFDLITSDATDSLYVRIKGDILDSTLSNKPVVLKTDSGNLKTTTSFCWQTACNLTGIKPQAFTITVTDNGCPLPQTRSATFFVKIKPMPLVNPTKILCMSLMNDQQVLVHYGDSTGDNNPYFFKYNFYRGINYSNTKLLDSIFDKSKREYFDQAAPKYTVNNYTYSMQTINRCGYAGPSSDTMGTFDQLKAIPDQQKLITVTVLDNSKLKIIWPPTKEKDFAEYFLYKSTRNNSNYKLIEHILNQYDTTFIDNSVKVDDTSYCYHLVMLDTCGNVGPMGKPSCSIVLNGISNPFEHSLSWLPYTYWDAGTENYTLYRKDTATSYILNSTIDSSHVNFKDDKLNYDFGQYNYYILANENSKNDQTGTFNTNSQSNEIELIQLPLVRVPNAFTSNNDGLNDDWGIRPVFVKDYHLKIYDRWGQMIFESFDKHRHWKGEGTKEMNEPTDAYVYLITYTGWDDSTHSVKGNVTILK